MSDNDLNHIASSLLGVGPGRDDKMDLEDIQAVLGGQIRFLSHGKKDLVVDIEKYPSSAVLAAAKVIRRFVELQMWIIGLQGELRQAVHVMKIIKILEVKGGEKDVHGNG